MILAFGFRNFFSFKEDVVISLRLDANCPDYISGGLDVARVLAIKGANGSGKTQVLKSISFLSDFCVNSFSSPPDANTGLESFYDNPDPSEFFIEFRIGGTEYRYELICNKSAILKETLFRTTKKRIKILERENNEIVFRIAALKSLDTMKLRKNASIISTAHQYEIDSLNDVYYFFRFVDTNVGYSGFLYNHVELEDVADFLATTKDKGILPFIAKFIRECDTGVANIKINSTVDKKGEAKYFPVFEHMVDGKAREILAHNESSGTKALFQFLTSYYLILKIGGTLIVDEFDINLHPHILPKLVSLFENPESNPQNAQLIVATHDSEILDILGRYRTYIVAKEENESFAYRLDEIPGDLLRNDRNIRPIYMSGRIGGVPRPSKENPEL